MIPPVEVRQIRPCEDCVCFIPGSTSCKMVYMNRRWLSKKSEMNSSEIPNSSDDEPLSIP